MNNTRVEEKLKKEPKSYTYIIAVVVIVLGLLVWSAMSIKKGEDVKDSMTIAKNIIGGILHPDLEFLFRLDNKGVIYLLFETMCIAFLGTIIGAIISIPFAFISAKKFVSKYVAVIGRFFTMCVDFGIIESLSAIGCTKIEQIRYGILPQIYSKLISIVIYRFDMNLRDASVLGLVGAGGIGAPLIFAMNNYRWNEVGSILVGIIVLVLIIEVFSNNVRRKLARGY